MNNETLRAPFVWYGGKSRAAPLIWERFGNVENYVEPFAGSLAVLLNRPHPPGIETVNDKDAFIANTWRALAADPEQAAHYATWPSNECDMHARHVWLKARRSALSAQLEGDPDYYDAKIAGWWLWGIAQWIGGGWASETQGGPWQIRDSQLVHLGDAGQCVSRRRLHLSNAGQGVSRKSLHLGDAGQCVSRRRLHLSSTGQGVSRKSLHLGDAGRSNLLDYFVALQQRLCRVRVCCGDWQRVMGPSVTSLQGPTGILFDPPYSAEENRSMNIYAEDSATVAHDVRAWCLTNGGNPLFRIVLCGYGDVHDELLAQRWTKVAWKAHGGYGNQGAGRGRANSAREILWFSPACLTPTQGQLFS